MLLTSDPRPSARLRHLAPYALIFVVLLFSLTPRAQALAEKSAISPRLLLLVTLPWLFGALLFALERQSRMKFWRGPLWLALVAATLVVFDNWQIAHWPRTPNPPVLIVTLMVNVVLVGCFTVYLQRKCPRCCPECQEWTMIPLRTFAGSTERTQNTLWCASCGALYWRTRDGEWKKERREIWLDLPRKPVMLREGKDGKPFDTSSRGIAPVVRTPGKVKTTPSEATGDTGSSEMAVLREPVESELVTESGQRSASAKIY